MILLDRKSVGARPWLNYRCTSNNALLTSGSYGGKLWEIVGIVGLERNSALAPGRSQASTFLGVKEEKRKKKKTGCYECSIFVLVFVFCFFFFFPFRFYDVTLEGN